MPLEDKLKLYFLPTTLKLNQPLIEDRFLDDVIEDLKLLDESLNSFKCSSDCISEKLLEAMHPKLRDSMMKSIRQSKWYNMWSIMSNSVYASMQISKWDNTPDSLMALVCDSLHLSMWASMGMHLSQNEYNKELFKDKSILEILPDKEMIDLCFRYNRFTWEGLFVRRSLKKGDFILFSWNDPSKTQTISII